METAYHIYYTDDDRDDQDMFQSVVDDINKNTALHLHDSGDELLQALKNPPPIPKVVFLDLNMPDKDGFEVLQEIRADEQTRKTPVVIFSTSNDEAAIERAKDLGANLYVPKPGSYEEMKDTVARILTIDWRTWSAAPDEFVYTQKRNS